VLQCLYVLFKIKKFTGKVVATTPTYTIEVFPLALVLSKKPFPTFSTVVLVLSTITLLYQQLVDDTMVLSTVG
jgi:hypothetical protein